MFVTAANVLLKTYMPVHISHAMVRTYYLTMIQTIAAVVKIPVVTVAIVIRVHVLLHLTTPPQFVTASKSPHITTPCIAAAVTINVPVEPFVNPDHALASEITTTPRFVTVQSRKFSLIQTIVVHV